MSVDPRERFSGRSGEYARTRPSYPEGIFDVLRAECGLSENAVVADLGSGTGIFSRLLLNAGAEVYAVEPNDDMRVVAEKDLGASPRFHSVAASAEATTLDAASVDLVTAAQAFHWFDVPKAKIEVARILRPGKTCALVWNDRDTTSSAFLVEFDQILRTHCPGYAKLQGKSDATPSFDAFFGAGRWARRSVPNAQTLDEEGLVERVMSASYAPLAGSPEHAALVRAVRKAFEKYADGGAVSLKYSCAVIFGAMS